MSQRQHGKHSKKTGAVKVARYQQLAYETEKLIADGILRPGDRLPSVRQTCRTYAISPVTVTQAYYLLESRGLIEARPKSGYFVRPRLGQRLDEPQMSHPRSQSTALQVSDFIFQILNSVKDPAVVPLGSSFPSPFLFPLDKLGRFLGQSARNSNPLSTVTDLPPGNAELRRQIALRYLARGATVSTDEIVITSGAMEGINLCLQAVTQPGDLIAIESPTFYAGLQASERLGLKVIEIPSHPREGIDLQALAAALQQHPIKACLLMLNFGNPTGCLVSPERKRALIDLLARHAVPLIEDDVYQELYFGTQPPLCSKSVTPADHVMHIGSFSKCLAPGYRLGWAAPGRFTQAVARHKLTTTLGASVPVQQALADYLRRGGYDKHLRRLRHTLASRKARMIEAVGRHFPPGTRATQPEGGYFLWVELPAGCDTLVLHRQALQHGISIAPGPIFSASRGFSNCLRLNYGQEWNARSEAALRTLGQLACALSPTAL